MKFVPDKMYHFYNRGNDKVKIFYNRENYFYFLRKVKKHMLPNCEILAYCLMTNHFHFLLNTKENLKDNSLNKAIGIILSSYSKAINKQENRTGSLFQQHSDAIDLEQNSYKRTTGDMATNEYPFICFNYIHQNPYVAGIVKKMEDWEFSSFKVNHQQKYWNITKNNFSFVAHIHYIRNHQILGMLNAILKFGSGCFL